MPEPSWFWPWVAWRLRNKKGPRPADAPAKIPAEAWVDLKSWTERHHHKTPPLPAPPAPTPPPPPPVPASWTLTKPVIFTAWDQTEARAGDWCVAVLCAQNGPWAAWQIGDIGWIAQAETPDQAQQAADFLKDKTGSRAIVATQGGWMSTGDPSDGVHALWKLGVNVCFGEAYQQDDPSHTPEAITWQSHHDGWAYSYPCVGDYHGYELTNYPTLPNYGKNFAVWLAEETTDASWSTLANLAH